MRPLVGAIADDVTGATDLCSVLAGGGLRTVQTIGVPREIALPESDAVVVALKSRTAPVAEAVSSSLAGLAWLRELGAERFYFKVCSTFDSIAAGNIGPVADALADAVGAKVVLVTPAYPRNGRTVYQGHLFVGDRLLSESSMAHHPLTPMNDSDLVRVLGRQTERRVGLLPLGVVRAGSRAVRERLSALAADGVTYAIADAVDDGDLRTLGEVAAESPFVVGGAGLAVGFRKPATAAAPDPAPAGPAVVIAGSCSAATREQVARMAARHPALKVDLDSSVDALAEKAAAHLADGPVLVYSTAEPAEVARTQERLGAEAAGARIEAQLAELARRFVELGARRLVVAGGETSGAVVQALGVRALSVGREIAPGVPWMTSLGEPTLALALKSGNFGGPDFFVEAVA